MLFSTILNAIEATKTAQKSGSGQLTYEITISDIISDYNSMMSFYNNQFLKSPPAVQQEFKAEVTEFYLIVDRLSADNQLPPKENDKLFATRVKVRQLKEKLATVKTPQGERDHF